MSELTSKQKKHLRGLAHGLSPVVHVGRAGVTDAVIEQIDGALADHELIKVRMQADREERGEIVARIVEGTGAQVAGTIGGVAILYRPHPDPEQRRVETG